MRRVSFQVSYGSLVRTDVNNVQETLACVNHRAKTELVYASVYAQDRLKSNGDCLIFTEFSTASEEDYELDFVSKQVRLSPRLLVCS